MTSNELKNFPLIHTSSQLLHPSDTLKQHQAVINSWTLAKRALPTRKLSPQENHNTVIKFRPYVARQAGRLVGRGGNPNSKQPTYIRVGMSP